MLQDLRFAFRQLRRTPVFAIMTIVTFGLGIGANAAVFSVMDAVVFRFLPVAEPDRLVLLHTSRQPDNSSQTGFDDTSLSLAVYEHLRAERAVFSELMVDVVRTDDQRSVVVCRCPRRRCCRLDQRESPAGQACGVGGADDGVADGIGA